ncbi:restriction endonuclease subunit S [Staphylococcus lugdunensis]|uniref:restriction endonuclease subunit S n=1 Tax=Staphylococcus lugdunensis TaxID=28035 RepID=UPI002263EFA6|nr:restriction endonuclease subunit S [Staphylococcus lugdunensis]UZW86333.1 restriction endonuclease subunit S [Staphylococcus lugdunensis]
MEYKVGDLCTFQEGYVNPSQKIEKYFDGPHKWVRAVDVNNNEIFNTSRTLSEEGFKSAKKSAYKFPANSIVITKSGTIGRVAIIKDEMAGNRATINIIPNEKLVNLYYLFYLLITKRQDLENLAVGSVQKNLYISVLSTLKINVPELKKQNKIAKVLKNIDDKIASNRHIIANLEELSQTLFKRWFVDFEFPDEDGNPYKSSGGEMVDSELGEIPKNWSIKIVKEIAESFNSIRKPLSKLEREKRESIYPYYGATKIIDYVDNYIFDGKYILVGEDGTVQTETGNPFIQYVWGKFWVSNHAHILKGKLISDELLMLYLKNTNVVPYITGAVQPKLNKKNLNSIKFVIADKETIIKFENFIKSYFQKIRILNKENKKLIELRDTLLPKLMSGELEIPDDVEVNMDELSI